MSGADVYDSSKIKVLKGLDAVRKRPACTSATPMTAPACTTWCSRSWTNSIDEALAGYCTDINVVIHADQSVHGLRQRPWNSCGYPSGEGVSAAE